MDAAWHFITLGLQYYVAGRSAAVYQLMPVTGNLLHHAVEMVMKSLLVSDVGLAGVTKFKHKLVPIWTDVVARHPGLASADHTRTINELDRFEELRYPDRVIAKGAAMRFGWSRAPAMGVPEYDLVMDDVDALFAALFSATATIVSPHVALALLNDEARNMLRDRNKSAIPPS